MQTIRDYSQVRAFRQTTPTPSLRESSRQPVRVCFFIDELALAGTETQLLALIHGLDRDRVRPYLCLLRGDNAQSRALEPADCPVLRLEVKQLARPSAVAAAWRLFRYLRHERIDVFQAYFPDSTYFGIPVAWAARVPCRVRTRNNLGHWLTPTHRWLGRLLNGLTTHTVVNCPAARSALLDHERPDPRRVFVLENGVNLERFAGVAPLRCRGVGEAAMVGLVGNLRAVKGIELLIEAARRVRQIHPQIRFRVAGEGEHRPALERAILRHGLEDIFELLGRVEDIPAFLADTDIGVLCSQAEGMPNAVLEYMAAGRPTVATNVGAVPDLIDDGEHGLIVPAGNADALTNALHRILSDSNLGTQLGAAARDRVRQRYSRLAMVRRFEEFFEVIASRL